MTPERAKQVCEAAESWRDQASNLDWMIRVLEGRPPEITIRMRSGEDYVRFGEYGEIFSLSIPGFWALMDATLQAEIAACRRRMEALELKEAE